ncbi:hypothetical protein BGZ76_010363 [Entomortierella beljakovae]|nr:hypothetical protein BGZ76_010363 [Entomortierella beljakovae]
MPAAASATKNANLQHLRAPRVRSVSSNSGVYDVMQQQRSAPPTIKPKLNSQRQPPSLLDIYAQQQHLQQYSNQRAQLSPPLAQQIYMTRNSKSTTSLPLTPTTPSTPSPSISPQYDSSTASDLSKASIPHDQRVSVIFESTSVDIEDQHSDQSSESAKDATLNQPTNWSSPENRGSFPGSYPINGSNKNMNDVTATNEMSLKEI